MKKVRVEDAVGMILAHDLTKIVPGEFKGAAFKKGHVIKAEDIETLKNMGKNHIYILELDDDSLHEDEAAIRIARAAAGEGIYLSEPAEGKVNFKASFRGLLKINLKALEEINNIDLIILATLHNNTLVDKNTSVAGTRIIPLAIDNSKIEQVEDICSHNESVISVKKLKSMQVGIVVTGTEVYEGRITDKFGPVLAQKVEHYGCVLMGIKYAPDNEKIIQQEIRSLIAEGAEIVMTSGGMSVDADDVTPNAIREMTDQVVTYGSPVLPGAMFMLAYKGKTAILGVPACGMYFKTTVLDLVLPRIVAGEVLTRKDLASLAHGGLCQGCAVCHYPVCSFGK